MKGRVTAVNISEKKGNTKKPIEKGNLIKDFGLEGDAHSGKWHRQVSLLAKESIEKMKALGIEGLCTGKFAENITTEGISLHTAQVGTRLRVGEAVLEISQIGKECHLGCEILKQVGKCIMPTEGIFARVIEGGVIKPGDKIEVL
ncbi:MAG: MOSC domain-containing protein [Clostridia bacterium]|jgi:MOSC domain-containing protein YiiM|nr:MOSC domain-containing protein [Clostridiales bacterium]